MNGQLLFWTPHTISTPHIKPFYCSIFEIWTLFDLEEYKDTISNKYTSDEGRTHQVFQNREDRIQNRGKIA